MDSNQEICLFVLFDHFLRFPDGHEEKEAPAFSHWVSTLEQNDAFEK